ncbi:hypothetical protein Cpin_3036 [Chitinophaga pinensis DSM 2588]|uniref:Uncharacterized protein n=1 Tax=Chitinophaga pinensis (strain ATCC 43595 / DSM 2588 / LMG 13176 / NBRC 15968 / NCIMB 11800 / UQM 2034) TaxID=485918 RepID=A0A979G488_CHIPD|nr:hypothetical protein Cpin_3036 [Chitinophaga pinensis DSM 2588]
MKNIGIFLKGAVFGGFIVYVFFFFFSKEWRVKRQKDLWDRRVREFRADTSRKHHYEYPAKIK